MEEGFNLVLENGEEITVTFPSEVMEELYDEMQEAQSKDGFWNVGNYTDAKAVYRGIQINDINMKRVVGLT